MPSPYYPFMPKKQKKKRKKKDAWSQVKELCLPVPRNSVRPQSSQIAYMLLLRPNRLVLISRSSRWPTTTTIKKITKWWRRRTRTATIEAHFIIYAMRIAKVKITENDDLTESTLRIWMNPSCKFFETIHGHKTVSFWYLTFWIYTFMGRAFCVIQHQFFSKKPRQQAVYRQTWFQ